MRLGKFISNLRRRRKNREIYPDEIFLDSSNLPQYDTHQFEGRIEKPISKSMMTLLAMFFLLVVIIYLSLAWSLQISKGQEYLKLSEVNRLYHEYIFPSRGIIMDRNQVVLASNKQNEINEEYLLRNYSDKSGMAHILGYVKYPAKDKFGIYYDEQYRGVSGVELNYNHILQGKNGVKIKELDALGKIVSESTILPPQKGNNLILSIDSVAQNKLYELIRKTSLEVGFNGGLAVLMEVKTGEIVAMTSYPEYGPQIMTDGNQAELIRQYFQNENKPFLNRVTSGLYTPGSIVKPFLAIAALSEKIISPDKKIISYGSISIPNRYDPKQDSVFLDWKAHGAVNMREALAVSSNVYFYAIGGGYEDQQGLGISNIEKYMRKFGFGQSLSDDFFSGPSGVIPSPKWKLETFNDTWRLGDTYHTSIGQYGFQITPMQALLAVSAISNNGVVVSPTIIHQTENNQQQQKIIDLPIENYQVVREAMRLSVTDGTARSLNIAPIKIAAKTGTAELGTTKKFVNSLVIGFLPSDKPKYAFVFIMEHGPRDNLIGAPFVAREFFEWFAINRWRELVE